ncbi:MAG: hypothetical protein WCG03_03375 [Kiritimatiellales bacterium]
MLFKENWKETQARFIKWWNREGLMVGAWGPGVPVKGDKPLAAFEAPRDLTQRWLDPHWRARSNEHRMQQQYFGLDILPIADVDLGPGSLALMAGSEPKLQDHSIWFEPAAFDSYTTPIVFDPANKYMKLHQEMLRVSQELSRGRYVAGIQDLVENLDILASLRDSQDLLFDLIERPEEVVAKTFEINQLFFNVYDRLFSQLYTKEDGVFFSAFKLWAPGKVAKVQCDISAMFSPEMFDQCVVPALTEQCNWLDYSMYHLDGSQAIVHLDSLLAITNLDAIEWTPEPTQPGGGNKKWFDMYRKIKAAGKSVQPIQVKYEEVLPLIDAVGPEGLYIRTYFKSVEEVNRLQKALEAYGY